MLKNFYFGICALLWLGLDQISKSAIAQNSNLQDLVIWQGVFHFRYLTNSGAAFSLFAGGSSWLKWISLIVSLGIIVFVCTNKLNKWQQCGYGCILGGALGNGIDRFRFGAVVDFLDFRLINFPVFNFADVAINLGLVLLMISFLQNSGNGRST